MNGTGSLVLTDDLEIYNRIGLGLSSAGPEWLEIGRGYEGDVPDEHGGRRGKNSTSEVYIRNMFDAWLGYMAVEAGEPPQGRAPHAARCGCAELQAVTLAGAKADAAASARAARCRTARGRRMRAVPDSRGAPAR